MTDIIQHPYTSILFRLVLAVILGGFIGLEREIHGRPAGSRTHILVCLGAAILLIAFEKLSVRFPERWNDGSKIAAGIVTGIGFLGAGAIVRIGDLVRGLTTAACIWFTAILGILIGSGVYDLAVISTCVVLIILVLIDKIDISRSAMKYHKIIIQGKDEFFQTLMQKTEGILLKNKFIILDQDVSRDISDRRFKITFQTKIKSRKDRGSIVSEIASQDGIYQVKWE